MASFSAFQTDPSTLLNPTGWYRVDFLADLFGLPRAAAEQLFGPGEITGQNVLTIITRGQAGGYGYVDPTGMTADTVAQFQARYPWTI